MQQPFGAQIPQKGNRRESSVRAAANPSIPVPGVRSPVLSISVLTSRSYTTSWVILTALEMQTESQRWLSFAGVAVEGGSGAAVLLVLSGYAVGVEGGHAHGDYPPLGMAVVALLF